MSISKEQLEGWYKHKSNKEAYAEMLERDQEEEKMCPEGICDGSGKVPKQYFDNEAKEWIVEGVEKCLCQLNDSED